MNCLCYFLKCLYFWFHRRFLFLKTRISLFWKNPNPSKIYTLIYSWQIKLVASINPHILSCWAFTYFPRNSSHIHIKNTFIMWNVLEILFSKFSASTAFTSMIYAHWFMIFMSWKGNINYLMIISHKIWFIYKINWYYT